MVFGPMMMGWYLVLQWSYLGAMVAWCSMSRRRSTNHSSMVYIEATVQWCITVVMMLLQWWPYIDMFWCHVQFVGEKISVKGRPKRKGIKEGGWLCLGLGVATRSRVLVLVFINWNLYKKNWFEFSSQRVRGFGPGLCLLYILCSCISCCLMKKNTNNLRKRRS